MNIVFVHMNYFFLQNTFMLGFLLKQAEPSFNDDSFVSQRIGYNARALENVNLHIVSVGICSHNLH